MFIFAIEEPYMKNVLQSVWGRAFLVSGSWYIPVVYALKDMHTMVMISSLVALCASVFAFMGYGSRRCPCARKGECACKTD